jgi:hypothetical protein
MFDSLLLRPSLHCNTPLHFTTLHPTTLHYTSLHFTTLIDTSFPLIYTSLPFHLALIIYISYRSISLHITSLHITSHHFTSHHFTSLHITSHHITRHSTDLIPKIISKKVNPFTALKNSPFHFTSLHFLFYFIYLFTYPINPTLHFTLLFLTTIHFCSPHFPSLSAICRLHFPSLVYTFLTLVLKIRFLPWEVPIAPSGNLFQSVMVIFTKEYFPISVLCFLALIFQ